MKKFAPLILLLSLLGCKQKETVNSVTSKDSSTYFSAKPTKYYYQFDSTKSEIENFDKGYTATFSVNKTQFKLFSNPDSVGDLELQVLNNDLWKPNLKMSFGINGNACDIDVNQDGFNDFRNSLLRGSEVYLFDSSTKRFASEPISLAFDWTIIDSNKKIYSNNYEGQVSRTDLFKLSENKQTILYTAPISFDINENKETATVRLYKVQNNDLSDTIFIAQQKFDLLKTEFDYKKYWKEFISRIKTL